MTKFIFVTGGVMSGIGKGVTAASMGKNSAGKRFQGNCGQDRSLPER